MNIKINGQNVKVSWDYNKKGSPTITYCSILFEGGTEKGESVHLSWKEKNDINRARIYSLGKVINKLYPAPKPTVLITNKRGTILGYDYTELEKETFLSNKAIRTAFYKAYFDRVPKISKKKITKALKNILTTEQIATIVDMYVPKQVKNVVENEV